MPEPVSPARPADEVTAELRFVVFGRTVEARVRLPRGPSTPAALLPLFRSIETSVLQAVLEMVESRGMKVSCAPGCAACCRKLVCLSDAEARRLVELMEILPEPVRARVEARFATAQNRLAAAGLAESLRDASRLSESELLPLGMKYFGHWIDCPFLEGERCVVYAERPMSCRECMVTSPPEHCFPQSSANRIAQISLPASMSAAVAGLDSSGQAVPRAWVTLPFLREWVQGHPEPRPSLSALEILTAGLQQLKASAPG